ncbi:uncharacterized protein LOC117262755 [Epinephelus lanceolatus]
MAHLPHRRHGNFPQRRATLLPRVTRCRVQLALEAVSSETGSNPETTGEEPRLPTQHVCRSGFSEMESDQSCNRDTRAAPPSPEKHQPGRDVIALLKRIRIHPEAQRILGNSFIPVVTLERLNLRSVWLSCLQPVVSLVRLPCQTRDKLHDLTSCLDRPQQNGFSHHEDNTSSPQSDLSQSELTLTSWTEPICPDSSPSEEPEQDSGFDCDSNPDQTYILFDSDEWDSDGKTETFYLDPDPEQTMVIQLDPEPDADQADPPLQLEDEMKCEVVQMDDGEDQKPDLYSSQVKQEVEEEEGESLQRPGPGSETEELEDETKCEVVQMDDGEDQKPDLYSSQVKQEVEEEEEVEKEEEVEEGEEEVEEESSSLQRPAPGSGTEEMESEDFCAVCLNGGDLLCCDRCPKVYHLSCHIPPLISFPLGDWACTLCRSDQEPAETYDCENKPSCGGVKAPYTLSNQDQRRCEKLTLLLYCHTLSAPFHEPVSVLARNYYQIIKRPIDLSLIRRKLDKSNTLHYFTAEQFVDDVLLMFKNCATFNYPDSEVAQAGRSLEVFFLDKLKEIFPDRTFQSASQDRTDRARLRWLSRKRKENYRKRRLVFKGKKYYL